MSLWKIAWRSMQQRGLASSLTALSMGLGVALVVSVLVIHSVIDRSFNRGVQGYDLIIGPKGGQWQLVQNSVFYLGQPLPQDLPYSYYREFVEGRFAPAIEFAIPICTGHDYSGIPAVATVPEMFEKLTYDGDKRYTFFQGENFKHENLYEAVIGYEAATREELKVGDTFSPTAGADGQGGAAHEDVPFTVVGILNPTGTPHDRAVFMNIEGFWSCPAHAREESATQAYLRGADDNAPRQKDGDYPEDTPAETTPADAASPPKDHSEDELDTEDPLEDEHAEEDHAEDADHADQHSAEDDAQPAENADPGDHDHECDDPECDGHECDDHECDDPECDGHDHVRRAVTAILVRTKILPEDDDKLDAEYMRLAMAIPDAVNNGNVAQAVHPVRVIRDFFDKVVGNVQLLLLVLAVLVVVVAGIGILVSIYNSMNDRRHDIAVMRALGASRAVVMTVILMESILLSLGGGALGLLLGHGLVGALSSTIAEQLGVPISGWDFQWNELVLIPGLTILATLVGFLPAISAYRTDVAKSLTSAP